MAGERAAVWVDGEKLTVEYATGAADGRRLKEVDEPRLHATAHASPQPFLPDLADPDWRPVQRLIPYRARRQRQAGAPQERRLAPATGAATGEPAAAGRRTVEGQHDALMRR